MRSKVKNMASVMNPINYNHLLIAVAHPDDEILTAAGLVYEMLQMGKSVTVCIVTNGDHECGDYSQGRGRLRDTLAGRAVLGLSEETVIFLGYADTGMSREESFLMELYRRKDGEAVVSSAAGDKTYGLEEKQDFHYECFGKHGSYCRNTLVGDLREVLWRINPDVVLTTHGSDCHGDHEALFYFIRDILEEMEPGQRPQLLVSIVHSTEGDGTWPLRDGKTFTRPRGLEDSGLNWEDRIVLPLGDSFKGGCREGNLKYEALCCYEIALEPEAADYLMAFIKEEELFWKIG